MAIHFKLGSRSTTSALNNSIPGSSKAPCNTDGSSKHHSLASVDEDCPSKVDAGGQSAFESEADLQRSTDYFGFAPPRLVDDVYNISASYIKIALDGMESTLLEDPETRRHRHHIIEGVARVQDKLVSSLERNIDRFELYASRNIFSVRSDLDISPAAAAAAAAANPAGPAAAHASQEEEMALDERLAGLHRSIRVAHFANRAMRQRLSRLDDQLRLAEPLLHTLAASDAAAAAAAGPDGGGGGEGRGGLPGEVEAALGEEGGLRAVGRQMAALEAMYPPTPADDGTGRAPAAGGCDPLGYQRCRAALGDPSARQLDALARALAS